MDNVQPSAARSNLEPIVITRLCAAAVQAVGLMLLFAAQTAKVWPATQPALFAALYFPLLLVPLVVVQGAGTIPARVLAVWAAVAAALGAVMGAQDILHRRPDAVGDVFTPLIPEQPAHAAYGAVLFIAQALITAAVIDRRRLASYATYFDVAWKQGVQGVTGAGFTIVFWIVLALGAQLFKLVNITALADLIGNAWFAYPVTFLAFATALHVTEIRPQIIRSIKTLILTLLSWLLPVAAGIAAIFMLSLPFTGLAALWDTKSATPILLGCCAGLIFLINAAYQDGAPEHAVSRPVRAMGTAAAVLLAPMVVLAAYGIVLRIGQYGLTADRVIAAVCIVVAACYAAGYLAAARSWAPWLKPIETCNTLTSFAAIAVLVALFTPLADPARLATNSQLARLESGKVTPERFDFLALRFDNGRYGYEAVQKLQTADGPHKEVVNAAAGRALAAQHKQDAIFQQLDAAHLSAALVTPSGARLPDSFLDQNWSGGGDGEAQALALAECVKAAVGSCVALQLDGDGDRLDEVIVIDTVSGAGRVFGVDIETGVWRIVAEVANIAGCADTKALLAQGAFRVEPPVWGALKAGDRQLPIVPSAPPCPK